MLDIHFVADYQESMALAEVRGGAVILSASGMCEAGRIRHHLRHNLQLRRARWLSSHPVRYRPGGIDLLGLEWRRVLRYRH